MSSNIFIGNDPAHDHSLPVAFSTGLQQLWAGGWMLTTDGTLDNVCRVLTGLNILSSIVLPFAAGHQLCGTDRAGMIMNKAAEANRPDWSR